MAARAPRDETEARRRYRCAHSQLVQSFNEHVWDGAWDLVELTVEAIDKLDLAEHLRLECARRVS